MTGNCKFANDMIEFFVRHKDWSRGVAGNGLRTEALTKHIEKECAEARAEPENRNEAIDLCILSMELYFRHPGTSPSVFVADLLRKMEKIEQRHWPKAVEGQPLEHVRGIHD